MITDYKKKLTIQIPMFTTVLFYDTTINLRHQNLNTYLLVIPYVYVLKTIKYAYNKDKHKSFVAIRPKSKTKLINPKTALLMRTIFFKNRQLILLLLFIFSSLQVSAQISVLTPEPAGNPALPNSTPWSAICAGVNNFNTYFTTISWAGSPNSDNEFILELSDANGDFTNAVELARTATENNNASKSFDIKFSIPTDTRGNGYKMRARSTSPASERESTNSYNMYYLDVTSNLTITEDGSGVPTANLCSTNPITIQVDNIANPETYQYIWYRSGTELSEKGHSLNVTQSGMYQAYIDYGDICTGSANTNSNIIDITIGTTGQTVTITPPTNTSLCPSNSDIETLSIDTTDPTWSYQWYKNGTQIVGAIAPNYNVNSSTIGFEGDYTVEISGNGICTEQSSAVTITNASNYTVTRNNSADIVILPSQTQTLSVSTTALSPTYQWFRNSNIIAGATSSTLEITQEGEYHVAVTQNSGSCTGTINSENTAVVSPASFEIITDYASSYTSCVSTSIVLEVITINAIASDGTETDVTADLINSFSYQWLKDGVTILGETSNAISLTNTTENGSYQITGSLNTYNETSNSLSVQLLTNEAIEIASTGLVYCNSSDVITISTDTDLSGETFSWEKDGEAINSTDASLNITAPGIYQLVIDKNGCPLLSNEITISTLDPSLIQLNVEGDVIFPEGSSKTVTATGGTAYQWFDENNTLLSSTDSMTFTEEGSFLLIANINNCEISLQINAFYLDLFNIPNVITPNGDGANDQWVIPNSYSNKQEVSIVIYNDRGVELLNETNYQNNWPQSTLSFPKPNMVFYYVIRNPSEILKQGTITVIK